MFMLGRANFRKRETKELDHLEDVEAVHAELVDFFIQARKLLPVNIPIEWIGWIPHPERWTQEETQEDIPTDLVNKAFARYTWDHTWFL